MESREQLLVPGFPLVRGIISLLNRLPGQNASEILSSSPPTSL